jgi:uncharacterized PurR-regulated membrane protein YhhQ (DUF165 family)
MQHARFDDSWVLPSRQGDLPGRPVLTEAVLHRRRERTFLVLAALFVGATAVMAILGTSQVIDVTYAISYVVPDLAVPFDLGLPLGVLAFPIALFAVNLVCELYGRRRANALVVIGLLTTLPIAGLGYLAARLDNVDASFGPVLALTSCYAVAHLANLVLFDGLRRLMNGRHPLVRKTISTVFAQVGGWTAFAFVSYGYAVYVTGQDASVADGIAIVAVGSVIYVVAFALVDLIPFAIAARSLELYLRVDGAGEGDVVEPDDRASSGPSLVGRLPPALIVEPADSGPVLARPVHPSLQLYTTGERRFFTEGEELSESVENAAEMPVENRARA